MPSPLLPFSASSYDRAAKPVYNPATPHANAFVASHWTARSGPARLLGVDRRLVARHVRPDDRRQRVDDDAAMGRAAPPAPLGDVGGHDDRDDPAFGGADHRARRRRRTAVLSRARLPHGMGGVQRRRHGAAMAADAAAGHDADDGGAGPSCGRAPARDRRRLSMVADQARVSGDVPVADGVLDAPLAQRIARRLPDGRRPRRALRRLLLGADAAALCRRGAVPDGDRGVGGAAGLREADAPGGLWLARPP